MNLSPVYYTVIVIASHFKYRDFLKFGLIFLNLFAKHLRSYVWLVSSYHNNIQECLSLLFEIGKISSLRMILSLSQEIGEYQPRFQNCHNASALFLAEALCAANNTNTHCRNKAFADDFQ